MNTYVEAFDRHITDMLDKVYSTQDEPISKVARAMADCILDGHNVFVFGPGHAGMLAEEAFYRAGGLAVINPLFNPCLSPSIRPITVSTATEALPGYATNVLENSPLTRGDFLLIHSVAARNPIVVEMALRARDKGIITAAIINERFASAVTSKDPSGKLLQEVVDKSLVIDNCGDMGDACIPIDGMKQKAVSTSSITGTYIIACLVLQICGYLQEANVQPPIFASSNVDGGAEINEALLKQYADRIFYM